MHICMAWSNTDGKVNIYADGKSIREEVINAGLAILPGGSLVLFQVNFFFYFQSKTLHSARIGETLGLQPPAGQNCLFVLFCSFSKQVQNRRFCAGFC